MPDSSPPSPVLVGPPQRELGVGGFGSSDDWMNSLMNEKVPELRFPAAYWVYDDMLVSPQVAGVFTAVVQTILGTGWRLDGRGCRPDIVAHCARDLALPVVGSNDPEGDTELPVEDKFSWDEHVSLALDEYLRYGHSVYEQKAVFGEDGLWHLSKLGWRAGRSITKFNTARDGGLTSVEQTPQATRARSGSSSPIILPVNRVLVYSRNRRGSNWRGESLLRPGYWPWMMSSRAQRLELMVAERVGGPGVVYEAAPNETDLTSGKKIATEFRFGPKSGAAIPNGAKLHLLGLDGTLPDLDKPIRRHDERIAGSMMANFLNLGGQSGTGSYALGSTFFNAFILALQKVAKDIARTASRHVVADLVRWNWPGERAPRLVFDEIGARRDALVQALATLVKAGVLTAEDDLEQFVRAAIGIPALASPRKEES